MKYRRTVQFTNDANIIITLEKKIMRNRPSAPYNSNDYLLGRKRNHVIRLPTMYEYHDCDRIHEANLIQYPSIPVAHRA